MSKGLFVALAGTRAVSAVIAVSAVSALASRCWLQHEMRRAIKTYDDAVEKETLPTTYEPDVILLQTMKRLAAIKETPIRAETKK